MAPMNAAVVASFEEPPDYQPIEIPQPTTSEEILVDVLAAGLHPRVRSGAAGRHYTSTGALPMIPGIDAVGRRPDGKRIYFVADDAHFGTMAEKALVTQRRAIELPDDVDVATVAATMNPAMSAWVALRRRVPIQPGQSVLVLTTHPTMPFRSRGDWARGTSSARAATSSGWPHSLARRRRRRPADR